MSAPIARTQVSSRLTGRRVNTCASVGGMPGAGALPLPCVADTPRTASRYSSHLAHFEQSVVD